MSNDTTTTQPVDNKSAWEGLKTLRESLNNPVYHIPVDMNINKFKQMLDNSSLVISKSERSRLIRQYKQKAWTEYDTIVKGVGTFPARNVVKNATDGEDNGK